MSVPVDKCLVRGNGLGVTAIVNRGILTNIWLFCLSFYLRNNIHIL